MEYLASAQHINMLFARGLIQSFPFLGWDVPWGMGRKGQNSSPLAWALSTSGSAPFPAATSSLLISHGLTVSTSTFTHHWWLCLAPWGPRCWGTRGTLTPPSQRLFSVLSASFLTAPHITCQLPEPTTAHCLFLWVLCSARSPAPCGVWELSRWPPQEHDDLHLGAII